MEIGGSSFFYALAALSMAFVGFSTIVITFRLSAGLTLTPLQALTTKQYVEFGFLACGFSLLPPLLALCLLPPEWVWRISSAVIVLVRLPMLVLYPKRRQSAVAGETVPLRYKVNSAIFALIMVALVANILGAPFAPGPGPVGLAVGHTLFVACLVFYGTFMMFVDSEAA